MYNNYTWPLRPCFKSFLLGSQDLKVNLCGLQQDIVMVKVRRLWELPGDSHAIAIQWVHMVKDPPATILHVHTVASKYTAFSINNDRFLITWP